VIDGVVSTADITITASIGGVGVTNGVVTIATAGSAAGDVDSATPTAANTVTAGQAIKLAGRRRRCRRLAARPRRVEIER
jgi:hypothetical protein